MALVTMKEILVQAQMKNVGVGMFNAVNVESVRGILEATEKKNLPVILALAECHLAYAPLELIGPLLINAARLSSVPVAVHLDHGMTTSVIQRAVDIGFTSVMFDGSMLAYEDNIAETCKVVEMVKSKGVTIEAELGHVGGSENGDHPSSDEDSLYTDPLQAADFVKRTGIDALAVAIGTVHGKYRAAPRLDFPRLREIRSKVSVPLVLHGGSGLSDDDFRSCIRDGIVKINICTDLLQAAFDSIRLTCAQREENYLTYMQSIQSSIAAAAEKKMECFHLI